MDRNPEELEEFARLILETARELWGSVLHGCNAQSRIELAKRMSEPQAGDWVFESSTSHMLPPKYKDFPAIHKIGRLVKVEREPLPNWGPGEPNPGEMCIYIRLLDGREYRWTNASVIAFNVAEIK